MTLSVVYMPVCTALWWLVHGRGHGARCCSCTTCASWWVFVTWLCGDVIRVLHAMTVPGDARATCTVGSSWGKTLIILYTCYIHMLSLFSCGHFVIPFMSCYCDSVYISTHEWLVSCRPVVGQDIDHHFGGNFYIQCKCYRAEFLHAEVVIVWCHSLIL